MPTILVTGGAGYVGSQSVLHFRSLGWRAVTLDDLSTGHADYAALADRFVSADCTDVAAMTAALASEPLDGVLHCAARSLVPESVTDPLLYFEQNVGGAVALLRASLAAGGVPIVLSSSAAVYGEPDEVPILESSARVPVNPYGFTKLAFEEALLATDRAHGLRSVALRYFNAAGADPAGRVGERHDPETHLIPNIIRSALGGTGKTFRLFGDDYPTRDGTCLRDYIHTQDVARAHQAAFEYLWAGGETAAFNIGTGTGTTVREVFEAARVVLGRPIPLEIAPRRPGDPAVLLADCGLARERLGWTAKHSTIEEILTHAVRWHERDR